MSLNVAPENITVLIWLTVWYIMMVEVNCNKTSSPSTLKISHWCKSKYDSASDCLKQLHWLPVRQRVEFKIGLLVYKYKPGMVPSQYLSELVSAKQRMRPLRSSDRDLLQAPRVCTETFGKRAFTYADPIVWNALPQELNLNIDSFKNNWKHSFYQAFY